MTVSTSSLANTLKDTLNVVVADSTESLQSKAVFSKWLQVGNMADQWVDDLTVGGPGLAFERAEGAQVISGEIREGFKKRYLARTFGLKIHITRELIDDVKYDKAIAAAKMLMRAMWKTVDIDSTNILVRATNSSYVGGDGVSLANASHTLPQGGTYSNTLAVPASPSVQAVIDARAQVRGYVGFDGVTEGYELEKVVCPKEQEGVWEGLLLSAMRPEAGNFSEINVVRRMGLDMVVNQYWTNTTTNWVITTDAEDGLKHLWRVRPQGRSWVDNDYEVVKFSVYGRWDNGWTNPRGIIFSNA